MKNILVNKKVQAMVEVLVSLFGLFMIYQILRRMLGGSWGIEVLIFGLVVLQIGFTFGLAMKLTELKTEFKHHRIQFHALATDFKGFKQEVSGLKEEVKEVKKKISHIDIEIVKMRKLLKK